MTGSRDTLTLNHWIAGADSAPDSGAYFDVLNPLTGEVYSKASHGNKADIDKAVETAHQAFASYSKSLPRERELWMIRAADLVEKYADDFVDVLVDEVGSPVSKARFEVQYAALYMRAAAGMTRRLTGQTIPTDMPGRVSMAFRKPIGVVAAITPFNVPLIKGVKQTASPLACGNTVVALGSEETPQTNLLLGKIYQEAGIPDGVYNAVNGFGHEIGDDLTTHEHVAAIMFTGSTRVGRHIGKLAGERLKKTVLELGGKSPLVVLNDADLDKAAFAAKMGCFFFQGQGCMVSSRIYVQEDVFDAFVEKLKGEALKSPLGDLRDPTTMVGPLISQRQRDRVRGHIEDARSKGANVVTGGEWEGPRCQPTILTGVGEDMTVCREETFGPVTSVYPVKDLSDALDKANDTHYGLSAAIFTQDVNAAFAYVDGVEAGMIHINAPTFADEPHVPFGGMKDSGFGREGTDADLETLTEWKWATIQMPVDGAQIGPTAGKS